MLCWQEIHTALFDLDGTLLDLHFDTYFWCEWVPAHYAELQGMTQAEAYQYLVDRFERDKGTLNWYCLDYWTQQLGLDIPDLKRQIREKVAERPYVRAFLKHLKSQGISCWIVTNAHPMSLDLKMEQTGLASCVDGIFTSHTYQHPKESQDFWAMLQKDLPFDRESTVFFDDSHGVLEAAKRYGIQHVIGISAPDSQGPENELSGFLKIRHFNELLPESFNH